MLDQLAWPFAEMSTSLSFPSCVPSCPNIGPTNGFSLSPSPHAVLLLMDRWHPIVYWAKVQCLIGHGSGNWASVSAWPSLNLPPKTWGWKGGKRKKEKRGRVEEWLTTCGQRLFKKDDLRSSVFTSLTLDSVSISVCVCELWWSNHPPLVLTSQ